MKIGKLSWLFLIIGVVVIAAFSLAMTHSSQTEQQNQLQSQLKDAQAKVAAMGIETLTAKQTQITQEIASYNAQVNSSKGKLTSTWDGIDAIKGVLQLAGSWNLYVTSIKSSPVGSEQVGGAPCDTLILDFTVQGGIFEVRDFVIGLSQKFPTATVKTVQINNGVPPSTPTATPAPPPTPAPSPTPSPSPDVPQGTAVTTAAVHMVIYSYGGN